MPTQHFNNVDEVYQSLTDFEIEDDSIDGGVPLAIIKVKGLHRIKVTMVNSWCYYEVMNPMKDRMLAFYAQSLKKAEDESDLTRIGERIKTLVNDITGIDPKNLKEKTDKLSYFFDDETIRREFFDGLKKMGIVHWWVSWKKWQRSILPHHTLTIFLLLWAFNFDGYKKKTTRLLEKIISIYANINSQSPIGSSNFTDFDTFRNKHQVAHENLVKQSQHSLKN